MRCTNAMPALTFFSYPFYTVRNIYKFTGPVPAVMSFTLTDFFSTAMPFMLTDFFSTMFFLFCHVILRMKQLHRATEVYLQFFPGGNLLYPFSPLGP